MKLNFESDKNGWPGSNLWKMTNIHFEWDSKDESLYNEKEMQHSKTMKIDVSSGGREAAAALAKGRKMRSPFNSWIHNVVKPKCLGGSQSYFCCWSPCYSINLNPSTSVKLDWTTKKAMKTLCRLYGRGLNSKLNKYVQSKAYHEHRHCYMLDYIQSPSVPRQMQSNSLAYDVLRLKMNERIFERNPEGVSIVIWGDIAWKREKDQFYWILIR